jgi:DNA repair exonuclease SbcCD nuclease subunit
LHTADWQIGKMFGNMSEASTYLRDRRIETVKTIASLASKRQVDAVLVAGDVFDDNAVHEKTLFKTINAMSGYTGPWLLLPGNHDAAQAESVWQRLADIKPDNIHLLLKSEPFIWSTPGNVKTAVLPAPLQRRHDSNDLTAWYDSCSTPDGAFRVGLAHGSVANRLPERGEAFNSISDLRAKNARLDYLALGDWHGTLDIADRTWYAGTPEQDRFRSKDAGNVLMVTIDTPGATPAVEKIATGHYIWCQVDLDLLGDDSVKRIDDALKSLGQPEDRLVVQLVLRGTLDLARRSELDRVLTSWQALLAYLRVDDSGLMAEPSAEDIEVLSDGGFVSSAVAKLKSVVDDYEDSRREDARLALQILYAEHKKLQGIK